MQNLRSVQQVFDSVIRAGLFAEQSYWPFSSTHMCDALYLAKLTNVIAEAEFEQAIAEIRKYMDEILKDVEYKEEKRTLLKIYKLLGKDNTPKARMWVYKNWADRPYFAPHQ